MMKSTPLMLLMLCWSLCGFCFAQSAPMYDSLVQQGKTQLQSGNNEQAVTAANSAIKLDATRWEGYALAGGALMNLKRYDEAADQLGHAIAQAPDVKQAGLRDLLKQCETLKAAAASASSGGASGSGPSYAETVRYIQDKIRAAGYPTPAAKINGVIGNGNIGVADTFTYDDAKYTFTADGCQSMTFTSTVNVHRDDYSDDDHSWHHKDGKTVTSYTVPFTSVGTYLNAGQQVPAVFSTHEIKTNVMGSQFADEYRIDFALNVMIEQLPPTQAIERGTPDHQDWHDAVWAVPKDLGVSWTSSDNSGDDPTNQSGNITKSGLPILMIRFVKPGTGAESPHVAKAIQHLVQLCASHPEQAPKELF
jgi:hypothetical protein